jgi:RimJ/RimL family protein N-acetyltransferase
LNPRPLNPNSHATKLFDFFQADNSGWTYLPYGPFNSYDEFCEWLVIIAKTDDPLFYSILCRKTNIPIGLASYLRINQEYGSIEIGHLHFSKNLKKTPIATEAMYLFMRYAFEELGYRRYEWKCDSLNQPSRNAAERLGFKFEGIFRQDRIYKSRNRDTAWFSVIDSEWPELKSRFQKWLSAENFDMNGNQILSLKEMI